MSIQKNEYKVFSETISMQAKMILLMFSIDNYGEDKNIEISAKLSETQYADFMKKACDHIC